MQNRLCQEAVDLTLKDIRNNDQLIGGIPVVFGGDFQQTLPVVLKGSREQIAGQCLQCSRLWKDVQILILKKNMHLESGTDKECQFAKWLLDVGHGRGTEDSRIILADSMSCGNTVENLIHEVYPGLNTLNIAGNHDQYFLDQTILSSRNDNVDDLNAKILNFFSGEKIVLTSADSVVTEGGADGDIQYLVEFLNTVNLSGMPLSKLELKIGAPVMIPMGCVMVHVLF